MDVETLRRLTEWSQRLANTPDLEEASTVVVQAPLQLSKARGAALWLLDGTVESSLVSVGGMERAQVPAVDRASAARESLLKDHPDWWVLPLRRNERLIGALSICVPTGTALQHEQQEVLRTWSHQASAVIESHRARALETIAFREVDRAVRADLNMREMMDRLLHQMISVCDAEGGAIYLYDEEEQELEGWMSSGLTTQDEFARAVIRNRRSETMTEISADADWAIGAPMMLGSRVEGAVVLTRSANAGAFPGRAIDLLSTLSSSAALIVRNAELYARSEEAVLAEERTRFAREIHDGLLQDLGFLVLKIGAALKLLQRGKRTEVMRELREISRQLRRDGREVRRMVFALRPLDIESYGLIPALEKYVKEFAQLHDLSIQLNLHGNTDRLTPKLETALFRLIQEALNNIRKHARAEQVWIDLSFAGGVIVLIVRDNGRGFAVESIHKIAHGRGSFGLVQMRERVERAGGKFSVESAPGKGTQLHMELPIRGP